MLKLARAMVILLTTFSGIFAQEPSVGGISSGDTGFVLICTGLVMFMLPGLAFFYGGLVRRKNVLGILMQSFAALCVVSLQWVLFGYSLAFHPGTGFWGGFGWAGLNGVGITPNALYAPSIPHVSFMLFQMMFAVITPALIVGAFAERMRFSTFLVFILLWSTFVYDPFCHWIWADGGWLRAMGVLDFAGGTVVEILSGSAALATAIIIGRRRNLKGIIPPHNLPFTVLGAGILWFGWFGFNAGSALSAGGLAAWAFLTTNTAAAAGGLMFMFLEWKRDGRPTMLGTVTGAVAGLVAITPSCGYIGVVPSMIAGAGAAALSLVAIPFVKRRLGLDDALDVFSVHGVGGLWGMICVGLFASKAVNPAGADGLLFGNPGLLIAQLEAVGIALAWSFGVTYGLYFLLHRFMGARVSDKNENIGLDLAQHHETGYTVLE